MQTTKFTRHAAGTPRLFKRKRDAAQKLGFKIHSANASGDWEDNEGTPVWPGEICADDIVKVGRKYFHFRLSCGGDEKEVVKCRPNGNDGRLSVTFVNEDW